jgi:hypothetical protein
MSTKSHIHKTYETLRKTSFCTKGYVEIHIQRPFLDNKIGIGENLGMKIQMVCTCFGAPSTHGVFFFEKYQNLNFGGISKFLESIVFRQILAILGSFRQIWADFAA